jgi:MFS family permease
MMSSNSETRKRLFYGWVVVSVFLIMGTVLWGIRLSFGVFFKSIEAEFILSRAATSTIFSVYMALGGLFTILSGWGIDRYGPRIVMLIMGITTGLSLLLTSQMQSLWQLYLTYSTLLAMGTSATFVVTMSTVSRWFDRKRGLALGIASSGRGIGMVFMAPFATFIISNYGWRTAYMVIGILVWLCVIPLCKLLKKDPYEIGALPDGASHHSDESSQEEPELKKPAYPADGNFILRAFRTRSYWLVAFIWLFFGASAFLVMTHVVPHVTDIGFSAGEAAAVLSVIGGTTIIGGVTMGMVSDRMGRKVAAVICTLLLGGAIFWLIWMRDLALLYVFAVMCGFAYGGIAATITALIGDAFGMGKIGTVLGTLDVSFGLGAAIGPAVGGLIFDISGSYLTAFLLGAGAMLITTLLVFLVRREMV